MGKNILLLLLLCSFASAAQNVYKAKDGNVKFFSHAPIEDIDATSKEASAALNIQTGEFAALVPIKSFQFKKSLMQEHFNENYMESAKYPYASFKGKIAAADIPKPGSSKTVNAEGDLTIHGVTKKRTIPVTLDFTKSNQIVVQSKFNVKLSDHDIKIPKLVFENIAEEVEATIDYMLVQE